MALGLAAQGMDPRTNPQLVALQQQGLFPHWSTIHQWQIRQHQLGTIRAFVPQGNTRAQVLRGSQLYYLSLYRCCFPYASAAEMNAFLFNTQPLGQRRLYSASQITEAEIRLGFTRKVGAVTAHQALLPRNIMKRWIFWNRPFPFGIANINRADLIDIDEAGVFLESVTRKFGKCRLGKRVREAGPYGHSVKWTLTMAISGDPAGERWVDLVQKSGTTINDYYNFILSILQNIPRGNAQRRRTFIMDNLSSHLSALIRQLIHSYGHRLVYRAPYYPVDGPIEFVFNFIEQRLQGYLYQVNTDQDLQAAIHQIIASMANFVNYFTNCGY